MSLDTTFKNLQVLEESRQTLKLQLKEKYNERIIPFIKIIQSVMKNNNLDQFESMIIIKDELDIYKTALAPLFFSAAIMEIVDDKFFIGFESEL